MHICLEGLTQTVYRNAILTIAIMLAWYITLLPSMLTQDLDQKKTLLPSIGFREIKNIKVCTYNKTVEAVYLYIEHFFKNSDAEV